MTVGDVAHKPHSATLTLRTKICRFMAQFAFSQVAGGKKKTS
jgi:hypothetical protein